VLADLLLPPARDRSSSFRREPTTWQIGPWNVTPELNILSRF
jgi:hypothetical protein